MTITEVLIKIIVEKLHFLSFSSSFNYRKTCQACKCPRDTHAIYHEQLVSVRDRLGFKQDTHTSKVDARQMGYTWVPPGLLTSAKVSFFLIC